MTEADRIARIAQLVSELHTVPPEKYETVRMPWSGSGEPLLNVIRISVDDVLLNPSSHRIRAQLQDSPEWQGLSEEPYGADAQRLIERYVREARRPEDFAALRESLSREGQTDPGVMTHAGLLINANTRAVAMRTIDDPAKRFIRVAVLPASAQPSDLALLELRLQMQKELKVEYTMTNELLFIEELSVDRRLAPAQIARELRIKTDSPRKGETEVLLRLKLLDLIRALQKIPSTPLPLTFFDRIELEQLRDVHRVYAGLLEREPARAKAHLESFLLSIAVDINAVHDLREVDGSFMTDFVLPQLEEDETLGSVVDAITSTPPDSAMKRPAGVDMLLAGDQGELSEETDAIDIRRLINLVTSSDHSVVLPGTEAAIDQDDFKGALKAVMKAGIKDKRRVKRDEDQLAAPATAIKKATQHLLTAKESLLSVKDDPEFDERRQQAVRSALAKLKRSHAQLEDLLSSITSAES